MRYLIFTIFILIAGLSFAFTKNSRHEPESDNKIVAMQALQTKPEIDNATAVKADHTVSAGFSEVDPEEFVAFAKTLEGIPYVYGSVDPSKGFDCSGFINYVSKRFGLKVPRSSVDFTNFGTTVEATSAKPGDLILFTGTDASRRIVGHIGIITENADGNIRFIHSSSGKGKGVVYSDLEGYYETRFVKVIRILQPTT